MGVFPFKGKQQLANWGHFLWRQKKVSFRFRQVNQLAYGGRRLKRVVGLLTESG
jgi:hypothetical protein